MSDEQVPQRPKVCIIVPAHNEAAVIGQTLAAMSAAQARVFVVANGCTDDTSEVARKMKGVTVIETPVGSKTNAINLGEQAADGLFPRFYVDADVLVDASTLERLCAALAAPGVLAVMPTPRFDLSRSSWLVCAHHRIWALLPFYRSGMIGSGAFGVNEAGRKRFGAFPKIIADDLFFKLQFKPGERVVVPGCEAVVRAPGTVWDLIKIKTRSHLGNIELRTKFPALFSEHQRDTGPSLLSLALDPRLWVGLLVYVVVKAITRVRVRRQLRSGKFHHWERDESSRRLQAQR